MTETAIPVGLTPAGEAGRLILAEALRPSRLATDAIHSVLAADALVATINGLVRARDLCPGTRVLTRDSGYREIRSVTATDPEALLLVSADVLGNSADTTIPARLGVMISGPSFETLFGSREVIVPAEALVDGASIRPLPAPARHTTIAIDLGDAEIIWADGLSCACNSGAAFARPVLVGREAAVAARLAGYGAVAASDVAA